LVCDVPASSAALDARTAMINQDGGSALIDIARSCLRWRACYWCVCSLLRMSPGMKETGFASQPRCCYRGDLGRLSEF
jgi:hypothetical protein